MENSDVFFENNNEPGGVEGEENNQVIESVGGSGFKQYLINQSKEIASVLQLIALGESWAKQSLELQAKTQEELETKLKFADYGKLYDYIFAEYRNIAQTIFSLSQQLELSRKALKRIEDMNSIEISKPKNKKPLTEYQ